MDSCLFASIFMISSITRTYVLTKKQKYSVWYCFFGNIINILWKHVWINPLQKWFSKVTQLHLLSLQYCSKCWAWTRCSLARFAKRALTSLRLCFPLAQVRFIIMTSPILMNFRVEPPSMLKNLNHPLGLALIFNDAPKYFYAQNDIRSLYISFFSRI